MRRGSSKGSKRKSNEDRIRLLEKRVAELASVVDILTIRPDLNGLAARLALLEAI